ncbi:MAG: tight adherence protein [Actinomycetota bacterium]|nr:tight adherence protein [Actinomycetota bacterium]
MRRLGAALALVFLTILAFAGPAFADDVSIRKVDTTAPPKVTIAAQVTGRTPDVSSFKVRENGVPVSNVAVKSLNETSTPVGVVLVIDTSGSMRASDKINQAKQAAKQFVARKSPNEQFAIVAFSDQPRVVINFTSNEGLLNSAIDALSASGETSLYDAVGIAAGLLANQPLLQPNIVILSDGADTVSTTDLAAAKASVLGAKAVVFAVGLPGGDFAAGPLQDLASSTKGQYLDTTDPTTLSAKFDIVRSSIENQYEITYVSTTTKPSIHIELEVGSLATHADVAAGSISSGSNTQPKIVKSSGVPSAFTSSTSRWIAVVLVLVAVALLAFGLALLVLRERSALDTALTPYAERTTDSDDDDESDGSMVETAIMRRAIDTTARLAADRGLLEIVEGKLEQADLTLRPAEMIFFAAVVAVLGMVVGFALQRFLGVLIAGFVFALAPVAILNYLAKRRMTKFTAQLPDTLQLLAGSLRAGYSLLQGVDSVAQQVEAPMGKELQRALSEARLGRPIEDALEELAARMGSPDFDWAVMAIRIQREVGGNLAELLQTVAETMIARERLRRDVNALTAEGKISAIVLGILPVGLGVFLFVVNPDYMKILFDDSTGRILLGGSIVLACAGYYWMMQMIKVDI